jgi:hypothetical protein
MKLDRRFGFIAVLGGIVLLGIAYLFTQGPADGVVNVFTGRYVLGGIAVIVCGGLLALFSRSK